jgi:hypothetical protein
MLIAGSYDNYYDTPDIDSLIRLYGCDLGMKDYPIWDETKRDWLNEKIINHFRYRKISSQTSTQFIFYLNRTLEENMPAINPVFVSLEKAAQDESWLSYMTGDKSSTVNNSGNENEQVFSTTPQNRLYENGGENYATNVTQSSGTNTNNATTESTHYGINNMVSTALSEWLSGVNNALQIVFGILEPCFIQVY